MLAFFSSCFFVLFFRALGRFSSFFLSMMVLSWSVIFSLVGCFSPFTGYSFVRLMGVIDSVGVLLLALRA